VGQQFPTDTFDGRSRDEQDTPAWPMDGHADELAAGVEYGERGMTIKLSPQVAESVTRGIAAQLEYLTTPGYPPVVLTTPQIRSALRQITSASLPALAVMSLNEVTRDTHVESAGQVGIDVLSKERRPAMAGA
jgi:flagellar biosynthesis protein FlhA